MTGPRRDAAGGGQLSGAGRPHAAIAIAPPALPVPPGGGVPRPSGTASHLRVLDWAGFRAAVTYTFDDTNSSQIQHYADLQALGVRMTFYVVTGKTAEFHDPIWVQAVKDGHEIGNHSRRHQATATAADVDAGDADIQEQLGVKVWTMASPFGNPTYPPLARTRYLVNRGVVNGLMAPNDDTDPFNLTSYGPPERAPAAAFNAEIDAARAAGAWKTVLMHGFTGGTDGAYHPVDLAEFIASVNYAKSLGDVWIDSMVNIAAYWRGQKMLGALTPATSDGATTWTWALPEHFPPGHVLRVVVDGGALRQGERVLAWNDHGYYEIALDAGTLTLSPGPASAPD